MTVPGDSIGTWVAVRSISQGEGFSNTVSQEPIIDSSHRSSAAFHVGKPPELCPRSRLVSFHLDEASNSVCQSSRPVMQAASMIHGGILAAFVK